VLCEYRRYAFHSQLGGLLHHDIHAFPAGDTLHEVNSQRGLGASFDTLAEFQTDGAFADARDSRRPLWTLSIEDDDRISNAGAQYFSEVSRAISVKFQLGAVDQCAGNK
jgi:hypothetical protein